MVIDFFTKFIGLIEIVCERIRPERIPEVALTVEPAPGEASCLVMAFSNLPSSFKLGDITFEILKSSAPQPMGGDAAAEILTRVVNSQIPLSALRPNANDISIKARISASKDNDAAFVDFCPVLKRVGFTVAIWVKPSFFSVDQTLISNLIVTFENKPIPEEGIRLSLSHPKNMEIEFKPEKLQLVNR
ncbi:MAG: hypothetical protein AAGA53_12600 [Pseudomonadota bacterium]